MPSKKATLTVTCIVIGTLIALVLLEGAATGSLFRRVILLNVGTIEAIGVGVYWDSDCSTEVTSIDWGVVEPGATKKVTVYVRNEGSAPVTLSLETENWNPSDASDYMSLTWNYAGQVIEASMVVQVMLSLAVSDTIEGITSFSFDIVIIGSA